MKKKIISLSLLTLGFCSLAFAAEYISPEVGFKKHAMPSKQMKASELNDSYKVESGAETSRQIASEVEAERDPSSVVATSDKKSNYEPEVKEEAPMDTPKPWLYKSERQGRSAR